MIAFFIYGQLYIHTIPIYIYSTVASHSFLGFMLTRELENFRRYQVLGPYLGHTAWVDVDFRSGAHFKHITNSIPWCNKDHSRSKWLPNQESGIFQYSIVSVYKLLSFLKVCIFFVARFSVGMSFNGVYFINSLLKGASDCQNTNRLVIPSFQKGLEDSEIRIR